MEILVPCTFALLGSGTSVVATVQDAQRNCLLYWRATGKSHLGVIELPPLVLHWRQQRLSPEQRLFAMQYFVPFMSPRDNESVVATVLMHMARAVAELGRSSILLSDLGIPVHGKLIPDVAVRLPSCFDVIRTDGNVTADNFQELVERVRGSSTPANTAVAFVNAATAPFADSFLLFLNFAIYIQEKQRVNARLAAAGGTTVPTAGADELDIEYAKLGQYAMSLPRVFLYVTDEDAPRGMHEQLLCRLCAHLRSSALAPSEIDLRAAEVEAAGASHRRSRPSSS